MWCAPKTTRRMLATRSVRMKKCPGSARRWKMVKMIRRMSAEARRERRTKERSRRRVTVGKARHLLRRLYSVQPRSPYYLDRCTQSTSGHPCPSIPRNHAPSSIVVREPAEQTSDQSLLATALFTAPSPFRDLCNTHALEMKPLMRTAIVLASNHFAIRDLITQAVPRFVRVNNHIIDNHSLPACASARHHTGCCRRKSLWRLCKGKRRHWSGRGGNTSCVCRRC
mmetsp:Transcript_12833/g.27974  ORF Transcript_12833/g.27974 Transcript_12833/m.27974 type:complete len:225 (-) Transcript_12833:545-1219(-)